VQILDKLFGPHSRNLERALDRTTLRHSVVSGNLANVNVPGYKRRDVEFGVALETAEGQRQERFQSLQNRLRGEVRTDHGSIRIDGNSVDLERETVAIAETELRYQMLTEMTSRYFSGLKNVIKEGR
jgi:flagellar basal-body rod protein FlgB